MKLKSIIILSIAAVVSFNVLGEKVKVAVKAKPVTKVSERTIATFDNESMIAKDNSYYNPVYCVLRGVNNLASCGAEVPRCIIYNSVEAPWYGWFTGIFEGAGLTACRALTGCSDIVTFGFLGKSFFSQKYPESPWDAVWIPADPQKSPSETDNM
jgi:hypothetical protein